MSDKKNTQEKNTEEAKIKIEIQPHRKNSLHVGKVYDLPKSQAMRLVKSGMAKYVN